jgi:ribosome silencing factor RsfS/YbeB/iojap
MDIRKLQRAIVDGLEDVKGHDIVVFNTEHLSPLFERVIIASGTSNRQTKALASSVRDAVKAHGERVLGVEGEDNGEWIIVDCGAAVAHIMQPAIRDYYRLEEIWGGKPVRMKFGAVVAKGLPKASETARRGRRRRTPAGGQGRFSQDCQDRQGGQGRREVRCQVRCQVRIQEARRARDEAPVEVGRQARAPSQVRWQVRADIRIQGHQGRTEGCPQGTRARR